jgi:hypothetical protein
MSGEASVLDGRRLLSVWLACCAAVIVVCLAVALDAVMTRSRTGGTKI